MLGILSFPLCWWLKWAAPEHYQKIVQSWQQFTTESILEKCIQKIYVLLVETECIQFL